MNLPLTKKQTYYISTLESESDKKEAKLNFNFLNRQKKSKEFTKSFKSVKFTKEKLRKLTKPKKTIISFQLIEEDFDGIGFPKKEVTEVKKYLKNNFGMSVLDIQAEHLLEFTQNLHNEKINNIEVNEPTNI